MKSQRISHSLSSKKRNRGFTIVELLIVIIVIAILAAITIVSYNGINARATDAAMMANVHQLTTQLITYSLNNGEYPQAVPESDTTLISQNMDIDRYRSMNFVVNRSHMTSLEQQKLASFESSTGINLPMNTLYFFNRDTSAWGERHAFVLALFRNVSNMPDQNKTNKMRGGANDAYPLAAVMTSLPSLCKNPVVPVNQAQSSVGLGSPLIPSFVIGSDQAISSITMIYPSVYNGLSNCSGYASFVHDRGSWTAGSPGAGLFWLE